MKDKNHWHVYAVWFLIIIISISTAMMIYLSSLRAVAFDDGFHTEKFKEFDIYSLFNSSVDIEYEDHFLSDYLERGTGTINSDFYNEKEKTHLVEVRDLFAVSFRLLDIAVFTSIFSLLALFYFIYARCARLNTHDQTLFLKKTLSRLLIGIGIAVFVFFAFFLFMILTFDSSFITFHELLFKTDTWMLDPATDNLIRMYPQQFFEDIFTRIISLSLLYGCILLVTGAFIKFWKKN